MFCEGSPKISTADGKIAGARSSCSSLFASLEKKTMKIMKEREEFHRSVNTTEDSLWTTRYRTIHEREATNRAYISVIFIHVGF